MPSAAIRLVVVLGLMSLVGIISVQVYWANQARSSQQQQFSHSVQMALRQVVDALCEIDGQDFPSINPIEQVSNNYFVVHTNNRIALDQLEYLLKAELEKRAINQNFEYGVYDCQNDQMVYGDFVELDPAQSAGTGTLPKLKDYDYYFGIYFPQQSNAFLWLPDLWKFTTLLTALIIVFLAYTLYVILNQRRLSRIQRDFVNNITHEFKTPLTTLKIATEVINDPNSQRQSDKISQYAQIIELERSRLEGHVQQLLKSAAIEEELNLKWESLDLAEYVKEILEEFQITRQNRNTSFDLNSICLIQADRYLLDNVVYNVLDNAFKYSKDLIQVAVFELNNEVVFEVKDDGPGIPEKERKRIFRKFYRITKGDTHDVKGFGLGLYVVQKAMKKLNGTIRIMDRNTFQLKFKAA